jgi:ribosome maturation factor RimP
MRSLNMLNRDELQEKLEEVISSYLKAENLILVDLNLRAQSGKYLLRILVDEPAGGIVLDRCTELNNALGRVLETQDLIPGSYILEVSSPGLDRPLLTRQDFSRCLKRRVKIFLNQPQGSISEVSGVIISVAETGVSLDSEGRIQQIAFEHIRKGKQVI